jgi:MerR family transcriptional regulator, thiopeptide resistance regulator
VNDHSEPRWRIGQVSARTGPTTRTPRYYELGLLSPSERWLAGIGPMRVKIYAASTAFLFSDSLAYKSQTSAVNLTTPSRDLSDTIGRYIGQLGQRMAALGRHRERMITVRESLAAGSPTDEKLLDILHGMAEIDHGLA